MNKGDLVTVLTNAGEFVGRLDKNDDTGVHLDNPKMIDEQITKTQAILKNFKTNTLSSTLAARGVCMTGEENAKSAIFRAGGVVMVTKSNPDINKAYTEIVSGLKL